MFAAMTLLLAGMLYTAPAYQSGVPLALLVLLCSLAEISQVAFVYLFPNGRFVPRWLGLLLVPLIFWRPWVWGAAFLPGFLAAPHTGETYTYASKGMLDTVGITLFFAVGIAAQVRRYRHTCTPIERQQMKWLIVGLSAAIVIVGSYGLLISNITRNPYSTSAYVMTLLVGRTARQLALLLIPITLTYSILRYRLWEIDNLISAALIWVPLTGIITGLIAVSTTVLQQFFIAVTGQQSDTAVVASTLLLVAAFSPIRDWLTDLVKDTVESRGDHLRRLRELEEQMRAFVTMMDTNNTIRLVLEESVNGFLANGGAVSLLYDGQLRVTHTAGEWSNDGDARLTLPLERDGVQLGVLQLGERRNQLPYHENEKERLQLTADLLAQMVALQKAR
jgi:hypothetical protein